MKQRQPGSSLEALLLERPVDIKAVEEEKRRLLQNQQRCWFSGLFTRVTSKRHPNHRAYKLGLKNGKSYERRRILDLLEQWLNDPYGDFDVTLQMIKDSK